MGRKPKVEEHEPVPAEPGYKTVGIPGSQADEVDRFIAQFPHFGIKFRSDFATRAILHYMEHLSREAYQRLLLQSLVEEKAGRPSGGPIETARRMGLKPPFELE